MSSEEWHNLGDGYHNGSTLKEENKNIIKGNKKSSEKKISRTL